MIQQFLSPELVHAIGWTLVHSLWQAAVFALALGLLLIALRKYSARARYNLSIGMLAAFFLTVVMSFGSLYQSNTSAYAAPLASAISPTTPITSPLSQGERLGERAQVTPTSPTTSGSKSRIENRESRIENEVSSFAVRVTNYYNTHLPLIVTLWLMGVLILQLRFLGQLAYLQRLKNYGAERFPAKMAPMLQELEAAIGISKPVRYLSSFRIGSPFTAGWWRPVVLFPATLLAELNEPELRTIIAHELAHVKRHDFLVNLGQTLVCILFFYHPAVWWMSARIEDEREHCCDDLAIAVTGERVGYAKTLIQLKEREAGPAMAMGFLGKGGGFKQRVTRLLSGYLGTGTYGEGFTSAVIIACIMAMAVTLSAQGKDKDVRSDEQVTEMVADQEVIPIDVAPNKQEDQVERSPDNQSDVFDAGSNSERFEIPATDSTAFIFLLEACDDGNVPLARFLLEQGVNVNEADWKGWTPLMVAAGENQADIVRMLIAAGAKVNYVNRQGWTALIEAADEGSYESAEVLLKAGADVNLTGAGNNRTALAMAASEGHTRVFSLLVQAGADIFSMSGEGSPMHRAAEEGQLNVVKRLIDLGADAGARDEDGRAPLSFAAEEGHSDVVEYLLRSGSNVNDSDDDRRTALSYAAAERNFDIVNMLITAGGETMIEDSNGMTALDYAVEELDGESLYSNNSSSGAPVLNHPLSRVIHALVSAGATSNKVKVGANGHLTIKGRGRGQNNRDNNNAGQSFGSSSKAHQGNGSTTSHELVDAVARGQNDRIDNLIARGDNLNGTTHNGRTPLTQASFLNFNVHTMQLLHGGADIDRADGNGYTPLTMAAQHNHTNTVKSLLRFGAEPDLADGNGTTAKEIALRDGSVELLRLLNKNGASITAYGEDGRSPLVSPARDGYVDVLRLLLEEGADPSGGTGCGPIFSAAVEGELEAVRLLINHKADLTQTCNYRDTDYFGRKPANGGGSVAIYEEVSALVVAIVNSRTEIVQMMSRMGADVNATCRKSRYLSSQPIPYDMAENMNNRQLARKFKTTYDVSGWTPLMEAVEAQNADMVKQLLQTGADKGLKTNTGTTALSLAKDLGFTEIADLLD
jgi:ankyrin repeat protein/beta-lactamase regulating signal transducer with metallopeptidase domain